MTGYVEMGKGADVQYVPDELVDLFTADGWAQPEPTETAPAAEPFHPATEATDPEPDSED